MGVSEGLRALVGELDSSIGVLERIWRNSFVFDTSRDTTFHYYLLTNQAVDLTQVYVDRH